MAKHTLRGEPCGCRVTWQPVEGDPRGERRVSFCPKHAAAEAMYEELTRLHKRIQSFLAFGQRACPDVLAVWQRGIYKALALADKEASDE